ncbi:MATE family efflux transporter [Deinococcus malanensis]|uniref:MATE family efflux transporter n=1 Tax=Deinococcus malanensis TaxID=1706855 RepID=UPI003640AA60
MVIQLVLTFVNQVIVGTLGAVAVAAVGLTGSLSFLFFITLGALGSGTSILVARRAGANDPAGVNHTLTLALVFSAVVAGVLTVPIVLGAGACCGLPAGLQRLPRRPRPICRWACCRSCQAFWAGFSAERCVRWATPERR